ncbi:MAG: hypothetical protein ABIR46_02450 [Candidatus Saccharimonadales bacterium]
MDFRDSSSRPAARPVAPAQTVAQQPQPRAAVPVTHVPVQNTSKKKWLVPVLLLLALLVAGIVGWKMLGATSDAPRSDRYQAVFLSTGQIYFGHLKNTHGNYLTLEQSYYTKSSELPTDATPEQKQATSNNVSLVKVGDEVYGPENTMKIRAEQVLFWQDLKTDSKVAKAIDSAN